MKKNRKKVFWIVGTFLLAWLCFCGWIVGSGLRDRLGHADLAVVFGGRVWNGAPASSLRARLDQTVVLYRQGWFPRILVSGGMGEGGYDEAKVMQQYLVAQGIPIEKIIVDSQGETTYFTAQNAACLMKKNGWGKVMLISQYFHGPRTMLAFRKFMIENIYWSHARFFLPRDFYSVIRESVGYLYYQFRSYVWMPCSSYDTTALRKR